MIEQRLTSCCGFQDQVLLDLYIGYGNGTYIKTFARQPKPTYRTHKTIRPLFGQGTN